MTGDIATIAAAILLLAAAVGLGWVNARLRRLERAARDMDAAVEDLA